MNLCLPIRISVCQKGNEKRKKRKKLMKSTQLAKLSGRISTELGRPSAQQYENKHLCVVHEMLLTLNQQKEEIS